MSKLLAIHDLIANDDKESPIKKLPYFNTRTDFLQFDPLEYLLGMERGGLVNDLPGVILLEVRLNLVRDFFEGYWIIVPEYDILQQILNTLCGNAPWDSVAPALKAETYKYTLFYLEDKLTIKDATGNKCAPANTFTSTLHPCLTIAAANRFFLGQRPGYYNVKPTGFEIMQKEDWHRTAFMVFTIASTLNTTCSYSFFATNRALDKVRPMPRYYLDDSDAARKNRQVVERPWRCIEPAEVEPAEVELE